MLCSQVVPDVATAHLGVFVIESVFMPRSLRRLCEGILLIIEGMALKQFIETLQPIGMRLPCFLKRSDKIPEQSVISQGKRGRGCLAFSMQCNRRCLGLKLVALESFYRFQQSRKVNRILRLRSPVTSQRTILRPDATIGTKSNAPREAALWEKQNRNYFSIRKVREIIRRYHISNILG